MTQKCEDCIHTKVCFHRGNIVTDTYTHMGIKYNTEKCEHYITKDVVPKNEVEQLKRNLEQCENGYSQALHLERCKLADAKSEVEKLQAEVKVLTENSITSKYPCCVSCSRGLILTKSLEEYDELLADIATEVAREIFEEIEEVLNELGYFDEIDFKSLKKKYTEGKNG